MSAGTKPNETKLRETLKENPADWEARKELAHLLYDQGSFAEAADLIWETDEIPSIDVELAFAARILAKSSPRKAIRLLTALLEHNRGKAVQNLGMANALMHHGMVLQASRFYGAAMEADPTMGNPDLEHFMLWIDDDETLWGNFGNRRPVLGQLPWMRDPKEAMKLTSRINTHTTPVKLPSLKESAGEQLRNDLYQQKAGKGADISPPPAVTIPIDRVAAKDRLFDEEMGAPNAPAQAELPLAGKEAGKEAGKAAAPVKREISTPDFNAAGATIKPSKPTAPALPPVGGAPMSPAVAKPAPTLPPSGGATPAGAVAPESEAAPAVAKPAPTLTPAKGVAAPVATLPTLDDFEVEELEPVEPVVKKKVGLPPIRAKS